MVQKRPASVEGKSPKLYAFRQIPTWLQDNQHIHTGYRAFYTTGQCLRSIFAVHNETGNIWTHLLGAVVFVLMSAYLFAAVLERSVLHFSIFAMLSAGCLACMLCSAAFHTMCGHEDHALFCRMRSADYFGITALIVGSFVPPCYYAFECHPAMRWGYLCMIGVLGCGGILGPLFNVFHTEAFFWPRLMIYVCMVLSGLLPSAHNAYIFPLNDTTVPVVWGIGLMFSLYGIGVVVYATKFPECLAPGRFDLFLHSHQLWHLFVLCAAVVHFWTCASLYQRWQVMKGNC